MPGAPSLSPCITGVTDDYQTLSSLCHYLVIILGLPQSGLQIEKTPRFAMFNFKYLHISFAPLHATFPTQPGVRDRQVGLRPPGAERLRFRDVARPGGHCCPLLVSAQNTALRSQRLGFSEEDL
ncbi:unnamed protein product [Rangifer tarandus platyrhynchus]|uniref:Uncharacterized protein n=1 Tax=Rangifer tarandus platyrhynchus TaxID=3082113 RepID=A0ABN8YDB9_RANTA|nr:unnamed protein product [Rangifer tarandus platyrhynchus]